MAKKRSARAQQQESKPDAKDHPKGKTAESAKYAHHGVKHAHTRRKLPNWPVLALAMAGMALSAFLAGSAWFGQSLPYCSAGSPCEVVQSSRWSFFLGLPVAAWGFATFAALAWIAGRVRGVEWHWKALWTVGLIALAISLYLSAVALFVLEAACFYCLASTGIALALFAVVAWQYPPGLPGFTWPSWLAQTGAVAVVVVAGMHFYYIGALPGISGKEDPYASALAVHLVSSGAQFYGAFWCGHCEEQKDLFDASAERLPYIECSPGGRGSPLSAACAAQSITTFPTWIIDGKRYEGSLSLDELAKHSRFVAPAVAPDSR